MTENEKNVIEFDHRYYVRLLSKLGDIVKNHPHARIRVEIPNTQKPTETIELLTIGRSKVVTAMLGSAIAHSITQIAQLENELGLR